MLDRLRKDELLGSGMVFLVGSLLVSILNYVYHLAMGRMLGPYEYGILGSLFAIVYLSTYAGTTFNRVTSKYSAEFKAKKQKSSLGYLMKGGLFKISLWGFLLLVLYLLLVPSIAIFMNLDDYTGLVLVGVIGYISIVGAIITGVLNGLQRFIWQNSLSFVSALLKFSVAVILVSIGWGVSGALGGVIIGSFMVLILGLWVLRDLFKINIIKKPNTREIYLYALPVLIASVLPLLAITLDQVLVKHLFSSIEAGHYAAAGNIAKIIWFGSGFLVSAIFPKIVSGRAQSKNVSKLLVKSISYTSLLALIGAGFLMATPRLVVLVMYGSEYLDIVSYVGLFGLAMGLFSINQVFITYNLAVEKYNFLWIIFTGIVLQIIGIFMFHSTLSDIVKILLLSQLFVLIGMFLYNKKELFNNGK